MNREIYRAKCYQFVQSEGIKFFGDMNNSVLCKIDNDWKVEIISDVREGGCIPYSYTKCGIIGRKVFFTSGISNVIRIYDIEKKELSRIELDFEGDNLNKKVLFWESFVHEEYYYVLGYEYPAIFRISAETNEVKMLKIRINDLNIAMKNAEAHNCFFIDGHVDYHGKLFFPTSLESSLLSITPKMDNYEIINTRSLVKKILSISSNGEEIWMTDTDANTGLISIWNINTGVITNLTLPTKGLWYAPVFYKDYAYLFPMADEGALYRIKVNTLECNLFEDLDVLFLDGKERNSNVMMVHQEGSCVTFIRRPDYTWFTYNFETGELTSAVYDITDERCLKALEKDYCDKQFEEAQKGANKLSEEDVPLPEFIKRL